VGAVSGTVLSFELGLLWPRFMEYAGGIVVAVSGMLSGVFVVTVNAWMNAPTGFEVVNGRVAKIDRRGPPGGRRPLL
jgi:cytochrome d ubiquinol oxidase subunit I